MRLNASLNVLRTRSASLLLALSAAFVLNACAQPQTPISSAAWTMPADVVELTELSRVDPQTPQNTIEVAEFFSYTCIHCARLQPQLSAWQATQPADVRVLPVAVSWRAEMNAPQRLYYTLRALNRMDLHARVFDDLAADSQYLSTDTAVLAWAVKQGIDAKTWQKTYHSRAVNDAVATAQNTMKQKGISSVPTLLINGRYQVIPSANALRTTTDMIEHLRRAQP